VDPHFTSHYLGISSIRLLWRTQYTDHQIPDVDELIQFENIREEQVRRFKEVQPSLPEDHYFRTDTAFMENRIPSDPTYLKTIKAHSKKVVEHLHTTEAYIPDTQSCVKDVLCRSLEDFERALATYKFNVLVLIGHGTQTWTGVETLTSDTMNNLLEKIPTKPQAVIFLTCFSSKVNFLLTILFSNPRGQDPHFFSPQDCQQRSREVFRHFCCGI